MAENGNDGGAAANLGGGGGGDSMEFVNKFTEPNRAYFTSNSLTSEEAVITALKGAEAFKGMKIEDIISIPKGDAKAEDLIKVYDKLGRPKDVAGYGVSVPEGQDPTFANEVLPLLHAAGLTKAQVDMLVPAWNKYNSDKNATANTAYVNAMKELETELGGKEKYDAFITESKRAATQFGVPQEDLAKLEGVIGSKGLWKFFNSIAKATADGAIKGATGGQAGSRAATGNPAEAKAKINELMKDKAFSQKIADNDPEANKYWQQLHQIAYPN